MAEYLVLIFGDEKVMDGADPESFERMTSAHRAFGEKHAGSIRGGNALEPTATATSIRTEASGRVNITDGAFTETKEALGGYYLIEAADLDAALKIAGDVPAPFGGIEVRPVKVLP